MPRRVHPRGEVPVMVEEATRAFGSVLRVRLIRHFLDHPGTQADAARELEVSSANVSRNTQVLIETGVVVVTVNGSDTTRCYSVDKRRLAELRAALGDYLD